MQHVLKPCRHRYLCQPAVVEPGVEPTDYVLPDTSLEEVLEEGLRRQRSKETWKVWQFDGQEFYDADSFRNYIHEHHVKEELLRLLPKDDPKGTVERPAEAALRQRMTDLLNQVQLNNRQAQEDQQTGQQSSSSRGRRQPRSSPEQAAGLARDGNVEMISTMLQALEKEHDQLYQSLLRPITTFVIDLLPVSRLEERVQYAILHASSVLKHKGIQCSRGVTGQTRSTRSY